MTDRTAHKTCTAIQNSNGAPYGRLRAEKLLVALSCIYIQFVGSLLNVGQKSLKINFSKIGQSHEGMSPLAGGGGGTQQWTPVRQSVEDRWAEQQNNDDVAAVRSTTGRLSWPGEALAAPKPRRFNFQRFMQKEWFSVFLWMLSVLSLSIVVQRLVEQSGMREQWSKENDLRLGLAILSDYILHLFPSLVKQHLAPGFFISNGVILLSIHRLSGSCPSLICRICDWQMGRLQFRGMLYAILVHSAGAAALLILLKMALPVDMVKTLLLISSGEDDDDVGQERSPFCSCLRDFVKETIVSTLFPVLYFVVPTLLTLNRCPAWIFVFLLYPLYTYVTNVNGGGSVFSPSVTLIVCMYAERGWWRIAAQCLGGVLSGRIMCTYFPDDPKA